VDHCIMVLPFKSYPQGWQIFNILNWKHMVVSMVKPKWILQLCWKCFLYWTPHDPRMWGYQTLPHFLGAQCRYTPPCREEPVKEKSMIKERSRWQFAVQRHHHNTCKESDRLHRDESIVHTESTTTGVAMALATVLRELDRIMCSDFVYIRWCFVTP